MKYRKLFLTVTFSAVLLAGILVVGAEAQTRTIIVQRPVARQVVVHRVYYDPFWRIRYLRYYDPFYADLYKSPYQRYLEERFYAKRELAGNLRELQKHQRKYREDGRITAKEREELADDIRDVQKARARLARLTRNYRW